MLIIGPDNIGRDSSYFQSTDTDGFYTVKPQKYFGISQEVAGVHATLKGAGLKDMLDKEGKTWMILRTQMTISKYASWCDEYDIETWCQEGYRLYCPRYVEEEEYTISETEPYLVRVNYYDTDYNRHVNNIVYINWLMESFPHEYLDQYLPEFFDVEWKKQCHWGDEIKVVTKKKEGSEEYYTKILHKDSDGNDEVVFHAITRWRRRDSI